MKDKKNLFLIIFYIAIMLLVVFLVFAADVTNSPTSCGAVPGSTDFEWYDCENATANDNSTAFGGRFTAGYYNDSMWYNFGFNLEGHTIHTLYAYLDASKVNAQLPAKLYVATSRDAGLTWQYSDDYSTPDLTTIEQTYILNITGPSFGYDLWYPSNLSDTNFRLRVGCNVGEGYQWCNLDWIRVKVVYT